MASLKDQRVRKEIEALRKMEIGALRELLSELENRYDKAPSKELHKLLKRVEREFETKSSRPAEMEKLYNSKVVTKTSLEIGLLNPLEWNN